MSSEIPALDPERPATWAAQPFETLLALQRSEVAPWQSAALVRRFEALRPDIAALDKLATKQQIDRIETVAGALPLFFDHRVYKSYPLSLIEKRDYRQAQRAGWGG